MASEKGVTPEATAKRSYVRKTEARSLLINAAIDLFRTQPFSQVTTKEIAGRAGLTPVAIQSAFGGQLGLYEAVAKSLIANVGEAFQELEGTQAGPALVLHPDLVLSARLVAWLRGEGVNVSAFALPDEHNIVIKILKQIGDAPMDPVLERTYAQVLGFAITGFVAFADEQSFPTEDLMLGISLIRRFRQFLSENQEELSTLDSRIQPH